MSAPRILIIRTSAMGDVVHALPVLVHLRRSLPAARIAWVIEDVFAPLLGGHPDLDRVIPVRLRQWRKRWFDPETWRQLAAFHRALDAFSAEVVLDLMGSHKAGVIGAWTLADRRLGLERQARREPSSAIWLSETVPSRGHHAVDKMFSVLSGLGLETQPNDSPDFAGDRLMGTAWEEGPLPGEKFALLHPLTAWENKNYPAESWSRVVQRVRERSGLETWVAWGPGERATAIDVADRSEARVLRKLPSLPQLVALSRAAEIVLGGDTGPIHLAHALGTPVVCVMGPTDPDRNGPYGESERAVVHRLPCSFCYQRLDSTKACLLDLSPDLVAERTLLALRDARIPASSDHTAK